MNNSVSSLKEDLRILGAIDVIANRGKMTSHYLIVICLSWYKYGPPFDFFYIAIALTRQCTGYLTSGQEEEEEGERREGEEREGDVHFMKLFRQLKLLENASSES